MFQNTNSANRIVENASQITDVAWTSINDIVTSIIGQLPYIVAGLLVLGLFLLLSKIFKSLFWATSNRTKLDYRLRILIGRLIGLSIVMVGFFASLTVIIPSFRFGDLIAGLGFTSFVVGFATKDILNNLVSGILILWKQPFQIGDYIFINKFQGKVDYIGVRATRLRADDGEQILIPNGDMYTNALIIRGAGANRRMSLKISIGYESDIAKAKDIIHGVLQSSRNVADDPKPNVYVTDLTGDGVNVAIYFWVDTDKYKPIEVFDAIASNIKSSLNSGNIEIYPPNTVIIQRAKSSTASEDEDNF
jgi:small conductance mechanosensitive channel